jgi:hypothetical protein
MRYVTKKKRTARRTSLSSADILQSLPTAGRNTSTSDPRDGPVGNQILELRQQGLFLLIDMRIRMGAVHNLLVFFWRDLEVFDSVLDKLLEVAGRLADFFHRFVLLGLRQKQSVWSRIETSTLKISIGEKKKRKRSRLQPIG